MMNEKRDVDLVKQIKAEALDKKSKETKKFRPNKTIPKSQKWQDYLKYNDDNDNW